MRLLGRIVVAALTVAVVGLALAHAQAIPTDGPTAVVMQPAATAQGNPWEAVGSVSWPTAAYLVVTRFLTVLERMVTDTRGWLDRWLDKTGGKIKIDFKRTGMTIPWSENDPDRTGPIPVQHNRRKTDRNGTSPDIEDDEDH